MRRHWLTAFAAVAVFALVSTSAKASLITGFAGNTQPMILALGDTTQGYINFAVYNTTGATLTDSYGTGNAGMDAALTAASMSTTSAYLYLFQNVNVPPGADIASSSVNVDGPTVTSSGILGTLTFTGVTAGHLFLGPSSATAGNISPAVTGATVADATPTAGGSLAPSLLTLNPSSLVATYSPTALGSGGVAEISTLWGYTSNVAPSLNFGSIQDSGLAANGSVPANIAAVPEPSTMVLAGIGALGMIGYGLRRRTALGA